MTLNSDSVLLARLHGEGGAGTGPWGVRRALVVLTNGEREVTTANTNNVHFVLGCSKCFSRIDSIRQPVHEVVSLSQFYRGGNRGLGG